MPSEASRKKAEILKTEACDCEANTGRKKSGQGSYKRFYCGGCLAVALDEARAEGAERERWECAHLQELDGSRVARDDDGKPNAWNTQLLIYAAIAARGPMRGPEEE